MVLSSLGSVRRPAWQGDSECFLCASGQVGFGVAYVKYSNSVTNLFGFIDSRNSGYLDVGANFSVTSKLTLNVHAGHQTVKNNDASSYSDWKIGVTEDFAFASVSLAAVGTNTNNYVGPTPDMKNLGKPAVVLTVTRMFQGFVRRAYLV